LRELQRRYALAVLVVHHAKKSAGNVRAARRCAVLPSSTPGATATSISAAKEIPSLSRSSTAPPQR
jgi:hypothetical protein